MSHTIVFLIVGLAMLVGGAELLVRGASNLALRFRITPLVIGLTVVAFGTSAPELAVSVQSGLLGQPGIAVGAIVGSNIFNVLMILGISALIAPLVVSPQLLRFDVPLMVGASLLFMIMAFDKRISLFDGLLLTTGIFIYTAFAIQQGPDVERAQEFGAHNNSWMRRLPVQIAYIVAGLVLLVLGADWLIDSAIVVAQVLGVSEVVIGLTLVAAGTSLPELATSAVAAMRGERDIAVGNVIGSCLFNILAVGGVAALVTPGGLEVASTLIRLDIPVMVAVAMACLPVFATGCKITRWEGVLFIAYYIAYIVYLVLAATQHQILPEFNVVMLGYALPLTLLLLFVLLIRHRAFASKVGS